MAEAQGLKQEQENNLRIFGELYQAAGDHRRALDFFVRARTLSDSLGLGQETGIILRAEARSQLALGRNDLAVARMKEALRSHQDQKAAFEEMVDLLSISEIDSHRDAQREIDQARRIAQTINTPAARADLALGEARLGARMLAWRKVLTTLQNANADIKSARLSGSWEPYALKARAYAALGIIDSAVISGRAAVAVAERVRSRIGTGLAGQLSNKAGAAGECRRPPSQVRTLHGRRLTAHHPPGDPHGQYSLCRELYQRT